MARKPATITKTQAAALILCVALAALLLAGSACAWIIHRNQLRQQEKPDTVQTPAQTGNPAGTIVPGVWIGQVDVSGLTEEQALSAVADYVAALPDEALTVTLPDRELVFTGVRTATASQAAAAVRAALASEGGAIPLTLDYSIQAGAIRDTIRAAAQEISAEEGTASYTVEDGVLLYTPGTAGVSLDTEALYDAVIAAYSKVEVEDFSFDYTEVSTAAEELALLREQIAVAPQNARYDPVTTGISEAVPGWDIDLETAARLLDAAAPGETVRIPLEEVPATIDRETLKANLFRESLGNCSSQYYYNPGRTTNLTLACQAINGTVIQPGETFSFNDVVGERTAAKGYQPGIVYVSGISAPEVGGGVCQVASTIYCAALYANLEIVERTEHMYLVSYVPYGMDATVSLGQRGLRLPEYHGLPDSDSGQHQQRLCQCLAHGHRGDRRERGDGLSDSRHHALGGGNRRGRDQARGLLRGQLRDALYRLPHQHLPHGEGRRGERALHDAGGGVQLRRGQPDHHRGRGHRRGCGQQQRRQLYAGGDSRGRAHRRRQAGHGDGGRGRRGHPGLNRKIKT